MSGTQVGAVPCGLCDRPAETAVLPLLCKSCRTELGREPLGNGVNGRPAKPKGEAMNYTIALCVSGRLREQIKRAARARKMLVSEFIRDAIAKRLEGHSGGL